MSAPPSGIIVKGVRVPLPVPVSTWVEHGLRFAVTRQRALTRAIVCHWTAAENPAARVFANMRSARDKDGKPCPLSVHFVVEAGGAIVQLADTEALCSHAKAHNANLWTIGIEFVCRGDALGIPLRGGIERPRATDTIHGQRCTYDSLTEAQLRSGVALVEGLCAAYKLPVRVPERAGELVSTELSALELAHFHGVLGHLHLEQKKRDPGLRLLKVIQARGRAHEPPPAPRVA